MFLVFYNDVTQFSPTARPVNGFSPMCTHYTRNKNNKKVTEKWDMTSSLSPLRHAINYCVINDEC